MKSIGTIVCEWSKRDGRVTARRRKPLALWCWMTASWPDAPPEAMARAALDGLRLIGLPWTAAARRLGARVHLCRTDGADLPDFSDASIMAHAEDWLLPHLSGLKTEADLRSFDLTEPLRQALGWENLQALDRMTPSHFETPLGRRIPIDYDGEAPAIEVRLQEMFGVTTHPSVGPKRLPLRITLLSPGQKPVQTTTDLPGFWTNSYADVRRDMRGPLPAPPLARRPARGRANLAGKAARHLTAQAAIPTAAEAIFPTPGIRAGPIAARRPTRTRASCDFNTRRADG